MGRIILKELNLLRVKYLQVMIQIFDGWFPLLKLNHIRAWSVVVIHMGVADPKEERK
jgi:hypothetical protein